MKFVIRSLLFVNLLLQMTNSLKSCFDHEQNIMITIILLAFSVIGLIGLVIGNRFVLIIFSASMTLILIATITIYAVGSTQEDSLKPKVPYYINIVPEQDAYERNLANSPLSKGRQAGDVGDNKLKSLVDKWLNKNNDHSRNKNHRYNKTRANSRASNSRLKATQRRNQSSPATTTPLNPALVDELSDEPTGLSHDAMVDNSLAAINARSSLMVSRGADQLGGERSSDISARTQSLSSDAGKKLNYEQPPRQESDQSEADGFAGEQVESEQWVAYERYLYERYLNIISQSIDLIMLSILAAWMALLLDEDSDHCFGPKASSSHGRRNTRANAGRQASSGKALPVYNYNGVRYSIRPDADDSPTHIVVH